MSEEFKALKRLKELREKRERNFLDSFEIDLPKSPEEREDRRETFIRTGLPGAMGTASGLLGHEIGGLRFGGTLVYALIGAGVGGVLGNWIVEKKEEQK